MSPFVLLFGLPLPTFSAPKSVYVLFLIEIMLRVPAVRLMFLIEILLRSLAGRLRNGRAHPRQQKRSRAIA
jgi:hypothetical protein